MRPDAGVFFSRRMAKSIDSAASSAVALGRGDAPQSYASGVQEFDRLHAALEAAGGILQQERESRSIAEQERAVLFASEQEARLLAENQNRAKDEFLAMLSHELRNPLAAISNSIALMEHPAVSAETTGAPAPSSSARPATLLASSTTCSTWAG